MKIKKLLRSWADGATIMVVFGVGILLWLIITALPLVVAAIIVKWLFF